MVSIVKVNNMNIETKKQILEQQIANWTKEKETSMKPSQRDIAERRIRKLQKELKKLNSITI